MPTTTPTPTLSPATRRLHWLVATFVVLLLAVGFFMTTFDVYAPMPLHKSLGMLALLVIVPRIVWRIKEGWPPPASAYAAWEHALAKLVHWVLLLGTLAMPLSGMAMSGAGGRGLILFGLQLLAPNPDPANPGKVIPLNETVAGAGSTVHEALAWVLLVALALHLAGALKHHIVDKDRTLLRMLGR